MPGDIMPEIIYPLSFEEGCSDWPAIRERMKEAAAVLESILSRRDSGFGCLQLELETERGTVKLERRLKTPCCQSRAILNIIMSLLRRVEFKEALSGCVIKLSDLSPLNWREQDLFTLRTLSQEQVKRQEFQALWLDLEEMLPGVILKEPEIARRERVLALWDPWRREGDNE